MCGCSFVSWCPSRLAASTRGGRRPCTDGASRSYAQLLGGLDIFFIVFFTFEALVKSIAMGFWLRRGAYLADNWNKMDFVVLLAM